ncbi:unnamed protein product [Danaus chrysippus]|uniref:(African queen) hypothetical protein n=1 Tax=Danaus chrysippus TaxID=151541 RepID=A0A8J2R4Z2_9NEOP|nr:unnamed protein product [Danaus chrysippus]
MEGEVPKFVSPSSQLISCSGLESSGPSQLRASFLTVAHLFLRNVPSALALKFLLTDSFLAVIQFCRGLTHFGKHYDPVSKYVVSTNEMVTWSAYCERQRRMRVSEAGVALHVAPPPRAVPTDRRQQGPPRHDDMPPGMQNNYQSRENTIQYLQYDDNVYQGLYHRARLSEESSERVMSE